MFLLRKVIAILKKLVMKNKLLFFIIILSIKSYSQDKRQLILGKIKSNSLPIENVHIINKNSSKATISNQFGEFQIPVKVNDKLIFSAIQFQKKEVLITSFDLDKKSIFISLKSKINRLSEVTIQKPENMAMGLNLPNAGKKPLTILESRLNYYSQKSVPIVILGALLGQQGGIDNLHYVFSGKRKRDRKLTKLIDEDKLRDYNQKEIQKIRLHFKDDFFIKTLHIPKEKINEFLESSIKHDLINMFNNKRIIEVIDILIKDSKRYLQKMEDD